MAGQPGPLTAHPIFELVDQRCNAGHAPRLGAALPKIR
jgi:hypothetical protein